MAKYVVIVETEMIEAFPVAVCDTYDAAFKAAQRFIEEKANDPYFALKCLEPFDYDAGSVSFSTEDRCIGNGKLVISEMIFDFGRIDGDLTVYEKVKTMTKEEFTEFMLSFYWKAWHDGEYLVDDSLWIKERMADFYAERMEEIFER